MSHSLTPYLRVGYFDTTSVADHTPVADTLILAAVAFPVLYRSEYTLAEETIPLGLKGTVINRLRLGYFSVGPVFNSLWRGQLNSNGIEDW